MTKRERCKKGTENCGTTGCNDDENVWRKVDEGSSLLFSLFLAIFLPNLSISRRKKVKWLVHLLHLTYQTPRTQTHTYIQINRTNYSHSKNRPDCLHVCICVCVSSHLPCWRRYRLWFNFRLSSLVINRNHCLRPSTPGWQVCKDV